MPDPAFPSDERTRLDPSNVSKAFTKICAKAHLRRRTPHDMRHTYASLLLSANVPLLYVSAQLGHSNGKTQPVLFEIFGEPGRNRTFNQQIKSLLLCQLSYGPTRG